jgi:hypothetical protein
MLSYNDVLQELQYYILDDETIKKTLSMKINSVKTEKPIIHAKPIVKKADEIFIPYDKDSLFWCFYIMKNGDAAYETMHHRTHLLAKQHKIELVTDIRKHKNTVKIYKFDTITNIESNLANDDLLSTKTFLTLCAIENINVVYVRKQAYFELLMNDTNIIYIVHELQLDTKYATKYGFEMTNDTNLAKIRNTLYQVDRIDKPVKSLSFYKVKDLIDICSKLSIEIINKDTGKNKLKNELYEAIIQYF